MNSGGIPIVLRDPEAERGIEHPLTFLRFRVSRQTEIKPIRPA